MRLLGTVAWVRASSAAVVLAALALMFGRPDLLVLGVPFAVWVAWALTTRPRAVDITVRGPTRAVEGESLDVVTSVRASHPVTVTLVPFPDRLFARGGAQSARGRDLTFREPVTATAWGTTVLEPSLVGIADDAGAWRVVDRAGEQPIEVRPATVPTAAMPVLAPRGVAGPHRARVRGEGMELFDVRTFVPGDRIRRVNWRVSSRAQALHVNQTEPERDASIIVCLDSLQDSRGPDAAGPSTLDVAARAALALAHHHLAAGDRVALVDLGTRVGSVPAGTGLGHARLIAATMARTSRERRATGLGRGLGRVAAGAICYVVTPLLDADVVGEIGRIRRLGATVVVVDTLPESCGPEALAHAVPGRMVAEAWFLRWLERRRVVTDLRAQGVPVAAWRGTGGLAAVAAQVRQARTAPRRRRG